MLVQCFQLVVLEGVWESKLEVSQKAFGRLFFLYALLAICVSPISGKLSFCHFGTEFCKNWEVFRWKSAESILFLAIFGENVQKYPVFERFGTEFSGKNWVFWDFWHLSFWKSGTEFFGFVQKKSLSKSLLTCNV